MEKKVIGYLQESNQSTVKRRDINQMRSRLLSGEWEINTWLDKDGGYKVELSRHTPRGTEDIVLGEGQLSDKFES